MHGIFPEPTPELSDTQLLERYAIDRRPYVRFNFVSSLDGSAQVGGVSAALGSAADQRLFKLLRRQASVVLVGAGTVRAEGYDGPLVDPESQIWREANGLGRHPALAILSNGLNISPTSAVVRNSPAPILLFTAVNVDPQTARHYPQHVQLIQVPQFNGLISATHVVQELTERGLECIHAEGGPTIFGQFIDQQMVDSLCLSISPQLIGGQGARIASGTGEHPQALQLHSVLHEEGMLLTEYRRSRPSATDTPDAP